MGLNVTAEDLALTKPVIFENKEVVEFVCLDAEENVQFQALNLKCKVLSGSNKGRNFTIRLSQKRENEIQRRKLATFALAFYTEDEIIHGQTPLARLVGRRFTAVAQQAREWQGKTYQDVDHFKDLGEGNVPGENEPSGVVDDVPF